MHFRLLKLLCATYIINYLEKKNSCQKNNIYMKKHSLTHPILFIRMSIVSTCLNSNNLLVPLFFSLHPPKLKRAMIQQRWKKNMAKTYDNKILELKQLGYILSKKQLSVTMIHQLSSFLPVNNTIPPPSSLSVPFFFFLLAVPQNKIKGLAVLSFAAINNRKSMSIILFFLLSGTKEGLYL